MVIAALLLAALQVPAEVARFVPDEYRAIAVERGDVNRDGREDYVIAIEKVAGEDDPEELDGEPREVRILTRQPNGSLRLARRAPKAIFCKGCGGTIGDPFMGITVKGGRFTIEHHGGSGWRWTVYFTFAWSRRDRTWQLVRVDRSRFHAGEPDHVEKSVETPKDFGTIDLGAFDAEAQRD